jgi:hypothetical protein
LDELVHRYGLPHRIITDLGSNFNNHQFWEYCENSGIDVRYVSVAHPRANGQVERANGMVLDALKKRLHDAANTKGGKWIKELPNTLWGLRTQPSKLTGQSPYFLVYGSEAILHAYVMWDSPAVEQYDEGISEDSRRVDIDGLEEARCVLTDKRRIPLRSASVRTPHLFHHGIPKVLVNPRSKGITSVRSTFTH